MIAEFSPQMSSTWSLSRQAALGHGPRLAYWSQGWNVERGFRRPNDLAVQLLRLALLRPADAQLCYTEAGADYLRRWLPRRRPVFVAQNTVDVAAYPGRDLDRSPADARAANLLFVGRLTADKNVPLLIRAFVLARGHLPGLRLTIVGDGPDRSAVQAAAAQAGDAVDLRGPLYDPQAIAAEFQRASLFVYGGSIGLAANQALAYGVPVMLFDQPAHGAHHPEHAYVVDGETGYRVSPPTEEALAARLVAALDGPQTPRQQMRAGITALVETSLQLDTMVSGFAQLARYFDTLGPRR